MRLRIIDVEGTPEEIAALPQLREFLNAESESLVEEYEEADQTESVLPSHVVSVLRTHPPVRRVERLIKKFLAEVVEWPDVDVRVGTSRQSGNGKANAIRVHRRGSRVGAFAYLRLPGGTMLLRLPRDLPRAESSHVTSRRVGPEAPYGLAVRLASEPALAEALELARAAYDEAHEPAPEPESD